MAFQRLIQMTIISDQVIKLNNLRQKEIKNLIDSFIIKDEKFIKNSYSAKFDVNFNKQNTILFFEKKNIFPSIPKKKSILILPIFIDSQNTTINLFNQNPFFERWKNEKNKNFLLEYILPTEDIDIINILNQNIESLENFNYSNIIKKYNVQDYIVCLIYRNNSKVKVLSKVMINNEEKIYSTSYENFNIKDGTDVQNLINQTKNTFEDNWKRLNLINRSVKLPLNISVNADDAKKNIIFEKFLRDTEFVSDFFIKDFNNLQINYRIIFNGSPSKFLELCNKNNISIDTSNQIWNLN